MTAIQHINLFIRQVFTPNDVTWTNTSNECPANEPLHYHHDGCPVCDYPSNITDDTELMMNDPDDGSWVGR